MKDNVNKIIFEVKIYGNVYGVLILYYLSNLYENV